MSLTKLLKKRLWKRFSDQNYPAEWDGRVFGHGKVSQRFWEYFIALEMMDLQPDSVVLEIGGGSPATGLSFFPRLLASAGISCIVLDVNFGDLADGATENVILERGLADRDSLMDVLQRHRPTTISCVSVLEHASPEQQRGIFEAIDSSFEGDRIVLTLEFHEYIRYFENQLTTLSLSEAVTPLSRYYLERIERSPIHCVNAFNDATRLWYPLALQFDRV